MKAAAANAGNTPKLTNQQYFEERKLLLEARVAHTVRFGLPGEPDDQSARVLRRLEARRQIQTFAGSDEDWDARSATSADRRGDQRPSTFS